MKKVIVFNGQFAPKLGGQFELEWGGQFAPKLVVNLHWKVVVNLTGFSSQVYNLHFEVGIPTQYYLSLFEFALFENL